MYDIIVKVECRAKVDDVSRVYVWYINPAVASSGTAARPIHLLLCLRR